MLCSETYYFALERQSQQEARYQMLCLQIPNTVYLSSRCIIQYLNSYRLSDSIVKYIADERNYAL